MMPKKQNYLSASQLATYTYCPMSFWLEHKFGPIITERMKGGTEQHAPLLLILQGHVLEERGYGKIFYEGHLPSTPALKSETYRILGKPDFILRSKYEVIPVELKGSAKPFKPWDSHILQLACYLILTEENYSKPKRGLIRYQTEDPVEIKYTPELKKSCTEIINKMHALIRSDVSPELDQRNLSAAKCKACSQRERCKFCKG